MTQENLLARYGILHELGRGATGAVYAARDRETGAVVALKRLDPALLSSQANLAGRFLKHARSARALQHRNIVEIHDAGEVGGTVYIAMEMLEGKSLRKILDEGPLPIARAIQIARDVASGLAHAHLQGVVHGALKPSNVVVLGSGPAKITDFGTGQGGPGYLSPAQLRGEPLDHRCDVFSLGALLYEMLTGRPPADAKPPPPSELNPHVPHALDAIVLSTLAAQPAARMPGVPILLRELQRLEEGLGVSLRASAGTVEPKASAPTTAPAARPRRIQPNRLAARSSAEELKPRDQAPDPEPQAFDYQKAMAMMERESRRERSSGSRPVKLAAFALAALGIAVAGVLYLSGQWSIAAGRVKEALATALETSRPAAPSPVAEASQKPSTAPVVPEKPLAAEPAPSPETTLKAARPIVPSPVADATPEHATAPAAPEPSSAPNPTLQKPIAAEPGPPAQVESVVARTPEPPAPPAAPPAPKPARAVQSTAKAPGQQPAATARLILAVSPQGELYIDGKHHGTTPPLTTFDIEPGMHRIEVRSGSRTPYLTYMMVQAGDVRRIQHDFDTTHAVHPPASASWRNRERASR
ncbi:MAG TPA: protein kinase [Burkholderiales bacterium]|nr:protein kinase [Burkholderiales bacterium]